MKSVCCNPLKNGVLLLLLTCQAVVRADFVTDTGRRASFDYSTAITPEQLPLDEEIIEPVTLLDNPDSAEVVDSTGELYSASATVEALNDGVEAYSDSYRGISRQPSTPASGTLAATVPTEFMPLTESILGRDERLPVTAITQYPYRATGRLGNGCTGTLIGPHHVLTSGHCVYNKNTGLWYANLSFSPGQNRAARPFGEIAWQQALAPMGWTQAHNPDHDYAVVILKTAVGYTTGWFGYGFDNGLPHYPVTLNGYPSDKDANTLWQSRCNIQDTPPLRIYYDCDTFNGESGSGVYVYFPATDSYIVYGIHGYSAGSTGFNHAVRINAKAFQNIHRWQQEFP